MITGDFFVVCNRLFSTPPTPFHGRQMVLLLPKMTKEHKPKKYPVFRHFYVQFAATFCHFQKWLQNRDNQLYIKPLHPI